MRLPFFSGASTITRMKREIFQLNLRADNFLRQGALNHRPFSPFNQEM
jgi:hypothetical protein